MLVHRQLRGKESLAIFICNCHGRCYSALLDGAQGSGPSRFCFSMGVACLTRVVLNLSGHAAGVVGQVSLHHLGLGVLQGVGDLDGLDIPLLQRLRKATPSRDPLRPISCWRGSATLGFCILHAAYTRPLRKANYVSCMFLALEAACVLLALTCWCPCLLHEKLHLMHKAALETARWEERRGQSAHGRKLCESGQSRCNLCDCTTSEAARAAANRHQD